MSDDANPEHRNRAKGDDELLLNRTFDAPLALVWRLWETSDHVIRWWGPEEFTCTDMNWELKPGHKWRAGMASRQYGYSKSLGEIREVEKHKRIVFTFRWADDTGFDMDTLVTVNFTEKDGKTTQSFHQSPFSSVAVRDSHVGGWNSLFNKQQLYVENTQIAESKRT